MDGVSVVIPAYNAANTISQTLQSLLSQTYSNWEAIIVDDGSEDNTAALVQQFIQGDGRFSIVTQENKGASTARNTGIKAATKDWLLFLDADDWIAPNYFETIIAIVTKENSVDAVHCGWSRVAQDGKEILTHFGSVPDSAPFAAYHCPFAIHACIVRRSKVLDVGGFDTELVIGEDWDLWQRLISTNARFYALKEVLAYYRVSDNSLTTNPGRFLTDCLKVLSRLSTPDPRIQHLSKRFAGTIPEQTINERKFYLCSWVAGLSIGERKDATYLLSFLKDAQVKDLDPYSIARSIFEAVLLPAHLSYDSWYILWPDLVPLISLYLTQLEEQTGVNLIAKRTMMEMEKLVLEHTTVDQPLTVGKTHLVTIEIADPIPDLEMPTGVHWLLCRVKMEGELLGHVELPVCSNIIFAWLLKDAIAYQFAWQILGRFFLHQHYQKMTKNGDSLSPEEMHNKFGWELFLKDIWGKPEWKEAYFYDKNYKDTSEKWLDGKQEAIEISDELPNIRTSVEPTLKFAVGGTTSGQVRLSSNGKLTAQEIRTAITIEGGFELCCICVREALLGIPLSESSTLRQRLQKNAGKQIELRKKEGIARPLNLNADSTLLLGLQMPVIASSQYRRAILPSNSANTLLEMKLVAEESVIKKPVDISRTEHVIYAPEMIVSGKNRTIQSRPKFNPEANKYGRQHFEGLFSKGADPWKYTSPYEQTKYDFTLSLIPQQPIERALELACAEGHFTVQLAPKVKALLATDISKVALERTKDRCTDFTNIDYQQLDMVNDTLPTGMDLIVCSEVLYYVGDKKKLSTVAKKMSDSLVAGGHILMAHAHQIIDEPEKPGFDWQLPFGAKVIGDVFSSVASLQLIKEIRTPLYRVQLFQKTKRSLLSFLKKSEPAIIHKEQPDPVPADVEDSVRWNGGKPTLVRDNDKVETRNLPILMYHRVSPHGAESMGRYRVTPQQFEEQLHYLKQSGYYSVSLETWLHAVKYRKPLPGLAVALTFDDGYLDFYEYAAPLLKKYGFSATVLLVTKYVGKYNEWDKAYGEELQLMDWHHIKELQQEGIDFGAHTISHPMLTTLSPEEVVEELATSRTTLIKELQTPVDMVAYPYGDQNAAVAHLAGACGYSIGLTCVNGFSNINNAKALQLPRIEVLGSDQLADFVAKISV